MPVDLAVPLALLLGLPAGTAARRGALVLAVPDDQEPHAGCPRCRTPFNSRSPRTALGQCPNCRQRIGAAALLPEVLTAVLWGLCTAATGASWLGAALCWLSVCSVALTLVDWSVHRLPDNLTLTTGTGLLLLLTVTAFAGDNWAALLRSTECGAALGTLYLLLALFTSVGLGDVKLAPVLGVALGWFGWAYLVAGTFAGFLLGSLYGIALLITRRATHRSRIAFGPWMAAGALTVCLLAA